jgi:oligopeptide/dipeptide ABC transporter ATP-binding protein
MVFQDPYGSLNPRMKVRDLVGEGLRIAGEHTSAEITEMVRAHLELVGLGPDSMAKYPHQFSGGQRQRLCIARAIIVSPKLLIADEAASALDVSVQMQILNLLLELRDRIGLGIVFISHDMGVIEYLCDRIAVMYRGRIVEENAAGPLLDSPRHPYTRHLISARPRVGRPRPTTANPAGEDDPNALAVPYVPGTRCAYAERCPRATDPCHGSAPPLQAAGTGRLACFNPFADEA